MGTGEFELIAKFVERLPAPGPEVLIASGDDAAVAYHLEGPVVVSVDALIEGVHFTRPEFDARSIGRKAMAAAISDLAAMGAEPAHAYVVVGLPPGMSEGEVLELADGVAEISNRDRIPVIGGDLVSSPQLMVSVTAIGGEASGTTLVPRSSAEPGNAVVVTGEIGGAAAALRVLQRERIDDRERALLSRQFNPPSRLEAGKVLAGHGATAMIDLSDGLGADADRLARASGVSIEIDAATVPFQSGALDALDSTKSTVDSSTAAVSGGEDYELLACIPPDRVDGARTALGGSCALTVIGSVGEGLGARITNPDGTELPIAGFDHLRPDQA